MHHHYPNYYEIEKKYRDADLARELEKRYWIEQAHPPKRKRRSSSHWRTFLSSLMNFFL